MFATHSTISLNFDWQLKSWIVFSSEQGGKLLTKVKMPLTTSFPWDSSNMADLPA